MKIVSVVGVFMISLMLVLPFVTALDNEKEKSFFENIFDKIKVFLNKIGLFGTSVDVYEEYLRCGKFLDEPIIMKQGALSPTQFKTFSSTSQAKYIYFYYGTPSGANKLISKSYLGVGGSSSLTFKCESGSSWNYNCFVIVAECDIPCSKDNDCKEAEFCDKSFVSLWLPGYGTCMKSSTITPPEPETEIECTKGQTKCEGKLYYKCSTTSGKWISQGKVVGKCDYNTIEDDEEDEEEYSNCVLRNTDADTNCNGKISNNERDLYISKWKDKLVSRDSLGNVLNAWSEQ